LKIAILGYGKMGKEIEQLALEQNHQLVALIDSEEDWQVSGSKFKEADVAIEFSMPQTAVSNIKRCFAENIPVVVGTTGWNDSEEEIISLCQRSGNAIFIAANYNIGVNIFFEVNKKMAALMNKQKQYKPFIEEIHHLQKLDQPSGTAIKLAKDIISEIDNLSNWVNDKTPAHDKLEISSIREGQVTGIHLVHYESDNDILELLHTAKSRKGFAEGALMAAEWLSGKEGVFGMNDLLGI